MRNKKLISMLMLSAGFVACTDEMVESNYAGNDVKKDLVEDVILNVTLAEDATTRAAYAGYTKEGVKGLFDHFYLAPEFDGGNILLSDQEDLHGDMLGLCLVNDGNAITNYPFYIAGYRSAKPADEAIPNSVYVFDDQATSKLYNVGVDTETEQAVIMSPLETEFETAVAKVSDVDRKVALEENVMDVREGIVRTNSGIMTGEYIGYFPYNAKFVEPGAIQVQGPAMLDDSEGKAIVDMFGSSTINLSTSAEDALAISGFNGYLFANSTAYLHVNGGTKAGDVALAPKISVFQFEITNTAEADVEKGISTGEPNEIQVKRITVRSTNGEDAFVLKGNVALDQLNSIQIEEATDMLVATFTPESFAAATYNGEGEIETQTKRYVSIPFYANPTVQGYTFELYDTKGRVHTYSVNASAKYGTAISIKFDLKTCEFVDAPRKIFDASDFVTEALAGGELILMKDIEVETDVITDEETKELTISGGKKLTLTTGAIEPAMTIAEGGSLVLNGDITVNGNITTPELTVSGDATIAGDIDATTLTVGAGTISGDIAATTLTLTSGNIASEAITATNMTLTSGSITVAEALEATTLALNGTTIAPCTTIDAETLSVGNNYDFSDKAVTATTMNVAAEKSVTLEAAEIGTLTNEGIVTTSQIDADPEADPVILGTVVKVGAFTNKGQLTVTNGLTVTGTLTNEKTLEVTTGLNAATLTNTVETATATINGENTLTNITNSQSFMVNAGADVTVTTFTNNAGGTLTWNTADDFDFAITNNGEIAFNESCAFLGKLTNNGEVSINETLSGKGEGSEINNEAADATINVFGYLELTETDLNINKGKVIVDGGNINGNTHIIISEGAEFIATANTTNTLEAALGIKSYNSKLTGIIVNATEWPESVTTTGKTIYLRDNMTFPAATSLNGDLVIEGISEVTSTEGKLTVSAITINASHSLTFTENSNVDVDGNITNNGTYDQEEGAVVWCEGIISGTGAIWTKKPSF